MRKINATINSNSTYYEIIVKRGLTHSIANYSNVIRSNELNYWHASTLISDGDAYTIIGWNLLYNLSTDVIKNNMVKIYK